MEAEKVGADDELLVLGRLEGDELDRSAPVSDVGVHC